ncbi:MAG: repressor LexA [Gammaproteobacteria bacterium]|nr:repressor LexA [Gammaproteobacteria bacterium]
MTQLEQKILTFISEFIAKHNQSPTMKEIGSAMSIQSRGTVHRYVQSLVSKGQLRRQGKGWRSIRLTPQNERSLTILPLVGAIEEGKPLQPILEQSELNVSASLLGPDRFVLKVTGDSMIDAGILDGDFVIIRKTDSADNDTIVVALIDDGEVALKRMRKHGDRIELIPANKNRLSLIYPTERVHIQGIVIGQLRFL